MIGGRYFFFVIAWREAVRSLYLSLSRVSVSALSQLELSLQ